MKTQVRFRSSKFPPYPNEEEQLNPGIWGKRLAEHLVVELNKRGIITGEIVAEDWGWLVPVPCERAPLAICCGHQDGEFDEFLCFTEPSQPILKKWFKKIDVTDELTQLRGALEQLLASNPDIREIEWSDAG